MNIKSLELKNKLSIEKTGEQYYDLTAPSFKYKRELGVKAIHYVTVDQAGRIDKISQQYFGTGAYIDAICIVNNIFNPFSEHFTNSCVFNFHFHSTTTHREFANI